MGVANEVGYRPPPEFQEDVKSPLVEISSSDSTELWLIQWPHNQAPDFGGQELTLKLHHDGFLGSFEGSSGKAYDVISCDAQDANATVFLPSASKSRAVGKISRRVSLVHYPDPVELQKQNTDIQKQMQRSSGTSLTNSLHHFSTPSQGTRRSSKSGGSSAASKHSSRYQSSLSTVGEPSKPRSTELSTQDSGRGHGALSSSGSYGHSSEKKLKRKKTE